MDSNAHNGIGGASNDFMAMCRLSTFKSYISLTVDGIARAWINRRANNRAFIEVKPAEESFQEVVEHLNTKNISFGTRDNKTITFNTSPGELQVNSDLHEWLAARLAPSAIKAA